MSDPYDRVPYTDHAYAESHPDRMAVVARLSGWEAPSIEGARVLELGCARGGNLLPMAVSLPRASFVGVDRSAGQIEEARRVADASGLSNVAFEAKSFEDVELADGSFDYVVAHGVYSWVPPEARRTLAARIARWLAPGGVAYVSLNVLPGWYDRMPARDFLRFAQAAFGESPEGAKASLAWLAARVSPELPAYRRQIEAVLARLRETDRSYLVHEYLEPDHYPVHVSNFLREVEDAGLAYLGDAIPQELALELVDDALRERASALDVMRAQELVDFAKNTAFRRALLVREDTRAARGFLWPKLLDAGAVLGLRVASRLRPSTASAELFESPGESVQVKDAGARRALLLLAEIAPRSIPVRELAERAGAGAAALAEEIFDLWLSTHAVDLHAFEPALAAAGERPAAPPLARLRAEHGGPITNLWHQEVVIPEDVVRFILARLDGAHTREDLSREVRRVAKPGLPEADARELVRVSVELLAGSGLLVG